MKINWSNPVYLSVSKLLEWHNPLTQNPWHEEEGPITSEMVMQAIHEGRLKEEPFLSARDFGSPLPEWTIEDHAERIAYLIVQGWETPISIDVGVPGYGTPYDPVIDGHHRLAAAAIRGDDVILASASGAINVLESLLPNSND